MLDLLSPALPLDVFVVMPNHAHGVLHIRDKTVGVGLVPTLHGMG